MSVQPLRHSVEEGRLTIAWEIFAPVRAISVSVATDSEFTSNARHFVFPAEATSCGLEVGMGIWYYRCGGWLGDERNGEIQWSGIHGPVPVISKLPLVPLLPSGAKLSLLHTQSLVEGVRFHTGVMHQYYAVVEYSREEQFLASSTKSRYTFDIGLGQVECTGLSYQYTYAIRIATFTECLDTLPKESVKQIGEWKTVKGKRSMQPSVAKSNTDKATYAGTEAILRDRKERPNMRFNSYAEYMEYLAARERTTSRITMER
jgi:hypothetical protein